MKIGLQLSVYNHLSLPDALRKASEAGYETVELHVHRNNRLVDLEDLATQSGAKNFRRQLQRFRLDISALDVHYESQLVLGPHNETTDHIFKGTPEEKVAFAQNRLKLAAQAAARLGITTLCGFCGCEDGSRWFPWPDPGGWERMANTFVARWSPLLDTFAEYGVRFAHECHPNQYAYNIETAESTVRLLDGRPEWGFNLDPANLLLSGVDPIVFIAELKSRIYHVHAKDGELVAHNARKSGLLATGDWHRPDRGFRFRIPGWGDVQWKGLLTELRLADYDYVLSVENEDPTMSREDGVMKAIAYLRPLIINAPFEGRWW